VEHCLLAGLLAVTDEELPVMLSDFYSKHMLANKPDGECGDHAMRHAGASRDETMRLLAQLRSTTAPVISICKHCRSGGACAVVQHSCCLLCCGNQMSSASQLPVCHRRHSRFEEDDL